MSSLAGHHGDEFFVVDLAVAVDIGFADHLVHFLVRQLLAQVGHHVTQLGRADVPVPVFVEYPTESDRQIGQSIKIITKIEGVHFVCLLLVVVVVVSGCC